MRTLLPLIVLALVACGTPAATAGFSYSAWLSAHPQAIVADGHSETTISVEVRNSSGGMVADGTLVEFNTSLGTIQRTARTTAGVARVRLQSSNMVGTAMVSAVVASGNAVAQLKVDLLEPGTEIIDESFIAISSRKYLGYDTGKRLLDSAGGVTVMHRGVTIEADQAQLDVARSVLRAKRGRDNILIKRGDKRLEASALYYDLNSMNGVILTSVEDGARRLAFRGRDLFTQEEKEPNKAATFELQTVGETTMFVKARSIVIRPGEEIKFKRAEFFLEGDRVLGVPLHVESLKGEGTSVSRVLTYGTEGLRLDLPIYYSLTPNGTGAVRIRHSQPGGWGHYGTSGWQADIEQEYSSGGGAIDGKLALNRITSGDWGARWTQRREFANDSQIYTFVDFPAHRNLFSSVDYTRTFKDYTFSTYLRGDKVRGKDGRYSSSAYLQTRSKPLFGDAVNYAFNTRLSYDSSVMQGGKSFGTGLGMQLYGKPLRFGASSGLNTSLTASHDFGGAYPGTNVNANANYYQGLGNIGQLGLNYSYSWSDTTSGYSNQRISADLSLAPSPKWRMYAYMTKGLTDKSTSAFGDISYMFLPTWRLHTLATVQKYIGYDYTDAEFAISKAIGRQEASIIWSQSRKRFRVEFSALSF